MRGGCRAGAARAAERVILAADLSDDGDVVKHLPVGHFDLVAHIGADFNGILRGGERLGAELFHAAVFASDGDDDVNGKQQKRACNGLP